MYGALLSASAPRPVEMVSKKILPSPQNYRILIISGQSKPDGCIGTLQVWFSCVDHQTRLGVPDFHCDASTKPSRHSESCNTHLCPPM